MELEGGAAFAALAKLLHGESGDWHATAPPFERLRAALVSTQASALDLAVLLRQALRFEHARRNYALSPTVIVTHPRFSSFAEWERVGLEATSSPDGLLISSLPWRPAWLKTGGVEGVDERAASEAACREFNGPQSTGDPFLQSLGRTSYRSPGQRAAVRAALSTPAGGTLVIALPTGEGKSMIFQLVQSVGFAGTMKGNGPGVTLVIVPTVALGVNHQLEAVEVCKLPKPLAYEGGNEADNARIAKQIADGTQGLCFASPEAACGALRHSLRRAAESGHLRAMVIDEAHLVDQWGTGFRTEFQELSGLRRELISAAEPDRRMRTLLLSATLTDSSLETLRSLFGTDGVFEDIAAVTLRPEPDYWIAPVAEPQVRIDQVMEALHHVPRPAVLYVTKVADAEAWFNRLTVAGFRRVKLLHGKTGRAQRERIVDLWRTGEVDIVVGTSAFGLGIDYAHARSVLHACVPETLDRFYQEVGRGGRDGRASLSLIAPSGRDFVHAQAINNRKVIGVQRGLERWNAMFSRKVTLPSGLYAVRIDGRPGASATDIDMFGDSNTDWNLRTLALMARAELIRLMGSPYPRLEQVGDWVEIDILDEDHRSETVWEDRVEPVRLEMWIANNNNLALMRRYLDDVGCPAEVFEDLYGADRVGRLCSRCRLCREQPCLRHSPRPVGEPRSPWPGRMNKELARLLGADGRLLVTYRADQVTGRAARRLGTTLQKLQQMDVVKLLILGDQPFDMERVLSFADHVPYFVSRVSSLAHSRLPFGTEIVMVSPTHKLTAENLVPRPENPRIYLVDEQASAPDGRVLVDVFGGRTLTIDQFQSRVAQ